MRQVDPHRLARHVVARLFTGVHGGMVTPTDDEEYVLTQIELDTERSMVCHARYPLIRNVEERNADK